ncbi:hypothetical protein COCC4DRAFT_33626 [Bipolaris maydis ATCC 48331]|uniref:Uncharacterized protein n=2 Tax=Cochliobolus heterostrophus TaxID=5016 RepID=M2U9T0_COCH5|nr:uncharacterized protein COCC4DRAFT_33626 [Bipolaris maydis ATCC 48331]EMD84717.1 hypothetical protein COCHEDRAFT_1024872 [Bipolaris maydis C5]EMD88033.1 hypothetical protein COCHEDRAFT_1023288 [Bipolaris maydis C5]ENI02384.1 hypothetical protein COCC4DRAFT_33626 [Bipolaris maydis ATCC 48331]
MHDVNLHKSSVHDRASNSGDVPQRVWSDCIAIMSTLPGPHLEPRLTWNQGS